MKVLVIHYATSDQLELSIDNDVLKRELDNIECDLSLYIITEENLPRYMPASVMSFYDRDALNKFKLHNRSLYNFIGQHDMVVLNSNSFFQAPFVGPLAVLSILFVAKRVLAKKVQVINGSILCSPGEDYVGEVYTAGQIYFNRTYNSREGNCLH